LKNRTENKDQGEEMQTKTSRWRRALGLALVGAALGVAWALPSQAAAVSVLLGPPNLSASDPFASCDALSPNFCTAKTFVPTALPEPGTTLITPADGTIVSWRVKGAPPAKLRLRVLAALGSGQFKGIATSGVAKVSDGVSDNTLAIGIAAGSQLGVNLENVALSSTPSTLLGNASAPGAAWSAFSSGLPDEASAAPTSTGSGSEPLFNATVMLAQPLLLNLTSTAGPESGGDVVVINGVHLAIATAVSFGGAPAQVLSARSNQIVVAAPPHAPGTVSVTVTTAGGANPDSPANAYTYNPVPPPAPDTTAPVISGLSISPPSFKAKKGAAVSFRSSEAASVRFTVLRKPAYNHGRFKALAGSFTASATAGANRFHFDARLKGKRLKPGRYRLVAVATDALGNASKPKRQPFKVLASASGP
jgi:hypothetical protein